MADLYQVQAKAWRSAVPLYAGATTLLYYLLINYFIYYLLTVFSLSHKKKLACGYGFLSHISCQTTNFFLVALFIFIYLYLFIFIYLLYLFICIYLFMFI